MMQLTFAQRVDQALTQIIATPMCCPTSNATQPGLRKILSDLLCSYASRLFVEKIT